MSYKTIDQPESGCPSPFEDFSLVTLVADLLRLSQEEIEDFESFTQSECNAEIARLVENVHSPRGNVHSTKQIVGRLFLLHQQRAKLQVAQLHKEVERLSESYDVLYTRHNALRQDLQTTSSKLVECAHRLQLAERSREETTDSKVRCQSHEACTRAQEVLDRSTSEQSETESHIDREYCTVSHVAATGSEPRQWASVKQGSHRSETPPSAWAPQKDSSHQRCEMLPSPQRKKGKNLNSLIQREHTSSSSDESDGPWHTSRNTSCVSDSDKSSLAHIPWTDQTPRIRFRELDSLAKEIESFDPDSENSNVDNYLRELEYCLSDLPHATSREKLKLIWKTTSRSVHAFIQTQPLHIRESYHKLCEVLHEEYSLYTDETSATLKAIQIKHRRSEAPREYYSRLRNAYFQGSNKPGLEEDQGFKSLFLHNLHPCVRTHVTLMCKQKSYTMQEVKKLTQITWETVVCLPDKQEDDVYASDPEPEQEGNQLPLVRAKGKIAPKNHSFHHDQQGRWKTKSRDRRRGSCNSHLHDQENQNSPEKSKNFCFEHSSTRRNRGRGRNSEESQLKEELDLIKEFLRGLNEHLKTSCPPSEDQGKDTECPIGTKGSPVVRSF